jgi:hypothetical protein
MFIPLVNILGMYATLLCVLLCGKPWHLPTLAAHHAADQRGQSIEVSGHLAAGIRPDSIVSRPDVWHDSV